MSNASSNYDSSMRSLHKQKRVAALQRAIAGTLSIAALFCYQTTHAQTYPSRPIRMVIPYSPGNSTSDILGRAIAQKLTASLGQQVIVENRPGAGAMIGSDLVAKSRPDGYTLLFGATGPNAINVSLYPKIPYDPIADFAPVASVAITTSVLVVHASVPANSVRELIVLAKKEPGKLTFGSAGSGGVSHLAGELFNTLAGVKLIHVPYKGMGPAVTDLLAGNIDIMFATMPGTLQHIQSHRLRGLAVATAKRSEVLPELPTVIEAGLPGFEASAFFGLFAAANTPADIVSKVNEDTNKALAAKDMRTLFESQGAEPTGGTPAAFGNFIKAEVTRWAKVVKQSGAKPE